MWNSLRIGSSVALDQQPALVEFPFPAGDIGDALALPAHADCAPGGSFARRSDSYRAAASEPAASAAGRPRFRSTAPALLLAVSHFVGLRGSARTRSIRPCP